MIATLPQKEWEIRFLQLLNHNYVTQETEYPIFNIHLFIPINKILNVLPYSEMVENDNIVFNTGRMEKGYDDRLVIFDGNILPDKEKILVGFNRTPNTLEIIMDQDTPYISCIRNEYREYLKIGEMYKPFPFLKRN